MRQYHVSSSSSVELLLVLVTSTSTLMYCRRFPQLRTVQSHSFHSTSHVKALSPLAIQKAEQISSQWKGTSATGGTTKNFIGGEFVESKTAEWIDTHDPVCNTLNGSYFPS